jgi:Na+/proline symporter
MFSVAYTDLAMGITMIIGMAFALPYMYSAAGGYSGITAALPADHLQLFGPINWIQALGLILPPGLLILGDANMYQRFFSARDEGVARSATLWLLIGVAYMEWTIVAAGWVGSALEWQGGRLDVPGRVIAYAARDFLPLWLGAVMMTTIMAVIVSTSISYLLVPATALVRDVYQRFLNPSASERQLVWLLRAVVVGLGIVAYIISTYSERFLEVALRAYTIYGTGVTPSLVAALTWKRATASGAVSSIVIGVATTLIWEFGGYGASTGIDPVIPAIAMSLIALIAVSFATKPPTREQLTPFFQK